MRKSCRNVILSSVTFDYSLPRKTNANFSIRHMRFPFLFRFIFSWTFGIERHGAAFCWFPIHFRFTVTFCQPSIANLVEFKFEVSNACIRRHPRGISLVRMIKYISFDFSSSFSELDSCLQFVTAIGSNHNFCISANKWIAKVYLSPSIWRVSSAS